MSVQITVVIFQLFLSSASGYSKERAQHSLRGLDDHKAQMRQIANRSSFDTDILSDETAKLGLLFMGAAEEPSNSVETSAFLRSFRPCAECKKHTRYGEAMDGGYIMCDDDLKPGQLQAAYSYGISGYDGWGNAVSESLQIPVFEYDCTNGNAPKKCPTCDLRFHGECINGQGGEAKANYRTLSQHLETNGHDKAADGSLLMKIDVEGAEWPVFSQEPANNLKKFSQIVVEFHSLGDRARHAEYLKSVNNILAAGFQVNHIHGNTCCGLRDFGQVKIPEVLEVTYVQRANAGSNCAFAGGALPPGPLDASNLGGREQLTPVLPQ